MNVVEPKHVNLTSQFAVVVTLLLPFFDPNADHTKSQPVHLYSKTVLLEIRMALSDTTHAAHLARWFLCRLNK